MNSSKLDLEVSDFWKQNRIYEKLVEKNKDGSQFNFIDGPPFVSSASLHFGHLMVSAIKSSIINYKMMNGIKCTNMIGYDTHGLPIEMVVNKQLNITTQQEIEEKIGIDVYNQECKKTIKTFSNAWTPIYERIGRFADYTDTYMTMDLTYMETVWKVFGELWKKGLVYKGLKVMPYSTACNSALSNFEANQNYKDIDTKSVYVLFESKTQINNTKTYFAVWTTTPWTLLANMALCMNANGLYNIYDEGDKIIICGQNSPLGYKKAISVMKGSDLEGTEYIPLYEIPDYTKHRILLDNYVSTDNTIGMMGLSKALTPSIGTGIVHLAPAFGEDDYRVCKKNNINEIYNPVDDEGKYNEGLYMGSLVTDKETNDKIIIELKKRGCLIKTQMYKHSYPFCYRTDTPLIYRAISSYFVNVTAIKDKILKNNEKTAWLYCGDQFKLWVENAIDWNISRNRYFGTPIPIWRSIDDENDVIIVTSMNELGDNISDLHRDTVDKIEIVRDGKTYRRITDVFDCWFESGCVPYVYDIDPNKHETLSDLVCESSDQIKCWFYVLSVISTALYDKPAFKNVVCTGMILDEKGVKFSKKYNNFKDPMELLNKYGADYIRLYLMNVQVIKGESFKFNEKDIDNIIQTLIPLTNGVKLLIKYYKKSDKSEIQISNIIDYWILSKEYEITNYINEKMSEYNVALCVEKLLSFVDDITNWYIKLNRDRLKGFYGEKEQITVSYVLYNVLMNYVKKLMPFAPFISEHLYQQLIRLSDEKAEKSCILTDYPRSGILYDKNAIIEFETVQIMMKKARMIRSLSTTHTSIKVPILKMIIYNNYDDILSVYKKNEIIWIDELNVMEVEYKTLSDNISYKPKLNMKLIGMKYKKESQKMMKYYQELDHQTLMSYYNNEANVPEEIVSIEMIPKIVDTKYQSVIFDTTMISMDLTYNEDIEMIYKMRELMSYIQKLRKENNINPEDKTIVYLNTMDDKWITCLGNNIEYMTKKMLCEINVNKEINEEGIKSNYEGIEIKLFVI